MAELAQKPYLALNESDARQIQVGRGDPIGLYLDGSLQQFKVQIAPSLPPGVDGIPTGLIGAPMVNLPAWSEISRCK